MPNQSRDSSPRPSLTLSKSAKERDSSGRLGFEIIRRSEQEKQININPEIKCQTILYHDLKYYLSIESHEHNIGFIGAKDMFSLIKTCRQKSYSKKSEHFRVVEAYIEKEGRKEDVRVTKLSSVLHVSFLSDRKFSSGKHTFHLTVSPSINKLKDGDDYNQITAKVDFTIE